MMVSSGKRSRERRHFTTNVLIRAQRECMIFAGLIFNHTVYINNVGGKIAMTTAIPTSPNLTDKVAIITGASRGIGAASARVFARAGATVVLAARDEQALAAVVREIIDAGGRALAVPT